MQETSIFSQPIFNPSVLSEVIVIVPKDPLHKGWKHNLLSIPQKEQGQVDWTAPYQNGLKTVSQPVAAFFNFMGRNSNTSPCQSL